MSDSDKVTIHIDGAGSKLPEVGTVEACPHCGGRELSVGFGLAGGGYGAYEMCDGCGAVVSKTQERDE